VTYFDIFPGLDSIKLNSELPVVVVVEYFVIDDGICLRWLQEEKVRLSAAFWRWEILGSSAQIL
jgi:hypothetical protein